MTRRALSVSVGMLAISIVGLACVSFSSFAQSPPTLRSGRGSQPNQPEVSATELSLQRELANALRARGRLGDRHPSVPALDQQIAELRKKLNAIALSTPVVPQDNPFDRRRTVQPRNSTDLELREMVQALTERVEMLEQKVKKLESRD
ncbi:MAG: hypothetical protein AAF745_16100 [Planctomycetota bacterium]